MRQLIIAALVTLVGLPLGVAQDSHMNSDGGRSGDQEDRTTPNVIDASGKVVGPIVYFGKGGGGGMCAGGVVLSIHGALTYARVAPVKDEVQSCSAGFQWSGPPGAFDNGTCSGDPFIAGAPGPFRPNAIIRSGANAMLYVASGAPSQVVMVRSSSSNSQSKPCDAFPNPFPTAVWALESRFDLTQHYPEPLRIGY